MRNKIVCIGQVCVDVSTEAGNIDGAFSKEGTRIIVDAIRFSLGGDATNVAVTLSKLGQPVSLISAVGTDIVGECLIYALKRYGIDTKGIVKLQQKKCATQIFSFKDRERTLFIDNRDYEDFDISLTNLIPGDVVALCSLLQSPLRDAQKVAKIAEIAHKKGAVVCADAYTDERVDDFSQFRSALSYIDFFFPNEEEALHYTGCANREDASKKLLEWGVGTVVMKLGDEGCMVRGKASNGYFPAFPIEQAVDTTGCGDNFLAGFLSGLLDKKDIDVCCARGAAVASVCAQYVGASTSPITMSMLEELLKRRKNYVGNYERNTGSSE